MTVDLSTAYELVQAGGMLGLLLFVLYSGARGWWVFGWQYAAVVKDRDDWKGIALSGAQLAKQAVEHK